MAHDDLDWNGAGTNRPATEDSAERGFVKREKNSPNPESYRDLGQSEELHDGDVSDIADEGPGHRG